jgi:hypothetical protein
MDACMPVFHMVALEELFVHRYLVLILEIRVLPVITFLM